MKRNLEIEDNLFIGIVLLVGFTFFINNSYGLFQTASFLISVFAVAWIIALGNRRIRK